MDDVERERIYDEFIAPKLLEVADLCRTHDLPMIAAVQYSGDSWGETSVTGVVGGEHLALTMMRIAARARGNLDSFVISLLRYCAGKRIDTSASMVANRVLGNNHGGVG